MKFKTKINTGYSVVELNYDLPRIPVVGETIRFYPGTESAVQAVEVEGVLWDLEEKEVIIRCF
jgi:hypothetical protein